MTTFSLIVNTYNRAHTIGNTLKSLLYLRHPNFEVIVVNGPSTDGTEKVLDPYRHLIRVANIDETNISVSRNKGIELARGDLVAFIDDDAVPELNWLDELEQHYAIDARLGGVGGFVRDNTGVEYQCKYIVCDRNGDAQFFQTDAEAYIEQKPFAPRYYSLIGVNSSFRKKALLDIGGFDEEYAYFLDETDVCVRLTDAGWLIRHVPNAEVYHNFAPSHLRDQRRIPTSLYYVARSKTYFAFRNALPGAKVTDLFAQAKSVKSHIEHQANRFHSMAMISDQHRDTLLSDAVRGFEEGIHDGFAYPGGRNRRLQHDPTQTFTRMVPILEAGERERLILISQDYPPKSCGGVGVFMRHLAQGLAADGHEVSVITKSEHGHTVDFEDGVWVHRVPARSFPNRQNPPLPDLPEGIKNYAYTVYDEAIRIQQLRGATKTISSIWDLESAACIGSKAFHNCVYLVTTYKFCLPSKPEWTSNEHFLSQHVNKMIHAERWAMERCDRILTSTSGILRDCEQQYEISLQHKASMIPFGLPPSKIEAGYDQSGDQVKILFVGRHEKRKGPHVLLEAIAPIIASHPNVQLQMVGNDTLTIDGETAKAKFFSDHPELKNNDRIQFFGQVDDQRLEELYAECDIFVAPSLYESFGLIYLEAMRCGKPCIGTRVGGIPDVISAETGILVPPGDAHALRSAILELVNGKDLRRSMGHAGKQAFDQKFSVRAFVNSVSAEVKLLHRKAV